RYPGDREGDSSYPFDAGERKYLADRRRASPGCPGWWLFRTELQHPLRHAAARTRSYFSVRTRSHLRRSEVVHLFARHGSGLRGDPDAPGVRVPEPEREEILWLRHFVFVRSPFDAAPARSTASTERRRSLRQSENPAPRGRELSWPRA